MLHFIHREKVGITNYINPDQIMPFYNLTGYELIKFLRSNAEYNSVTPYEEGKLLSRQETGTIYYHKTLNYDMPSPTKETLIGYGDINIEKAEKSKITIQRDAWIDKYIISLRTLDSNNQVVKNYMQNYSAAPFAENDSPDISNYLCIITDEKYTPILAGVIDLDGMEKTDHTVILTLYNFSYLIAKLSKLTKWYIRTEENRPPTIHEVSWGTNDEGQLGNYIMQPKNRIKELAYNIKDQYKIPVKYNNLDEIDFNYLNVNNYKPILNITIPSNKSVKVTDLYNHTAPYKESYATSGNSSSIFFIYYANLTTFSPPQQIFDFIRIRITPLSYELLPNNDWKLYSCSTEIPYTQAHAGAIARLKEYFGIENLQELQNGSTYIDQSEINENNGESNYNTCITKDGMNLEIKQKGKLFGKRIIFDNDPQIKIEEMLSIILKRSRATIKSDGLFGINVKNKDITIENPILINRRDIVIKNIIRLIPEKIDISVFDKLNIKEAEAEAINDLIKNETNNELKKYEAEAEAVIKGNYAIEIGNMLLVENDKYLVVEKLEENGLTKCNVWQKSI